MHLIRVGLGQPGKSTSQPSCTLLTSHQFTWSVGRRLSPQLQRLLQGTPDKAPGFPRAELGRKGGGGQCGGDGLHVGSRLATPNHSAISDSLKRVTRSGLHSEAPIPGDRPLGTASEAALQSVCVYACMHVGMRLERDSWLILFENFAYIVVCLIFKFLMPVFTCFTSLGIYLTQVVFQIHLYVFFPNYLLNFFRCLWLSPLSLHVLHACILSPVPFRYLSY